MKEEENNLFRVKVVRWRKKGKISIFKSKRPAACNDMNKVFIFFVDTERVKSLDIYKDDSFWEKEMFPKLEKLKMYCILPELVDPLEKAKTCWLQIHLTFLTIQNGVAYIYTLDSPCILTYFDLSPIS